MNVFLALSALVWLPYGLFCLFNPGFLTEAAGVSATSATGTTELRAMYGGLQAAVGLFAGAALVRPDLVRAALTMLLFLTAGLGGARITGVLLDGGPSAYTVCAVAFELTCAGVAFVLLRRSA